MRIQFFPEPELEVKLNDEATKQGVNVSILVVDALNKYYGLVGPNTKTEAQLETEVLDVGKTFAKEIGVPGRFEKVEQVLLANGKPKRTVGNRVAIY